MEERVRFQILGPTRLRVGPKEIAINSIRDRMFLATLILRVGEPVPAPYLVDAIWGERPPRDSRSQLHGCVWRLRRLLVDAGGSRLLIATDPAGYRLVADPTDVDLGEFRQLREAARRATADGDRATASQRYRAALALWRGPALAEIESDVIKQSAAALDEEHIQAVEECYDVELADGKADELIPELTERVHQHPYRERLHGALMLALYRAGRQSDALAAYRNIRQTLLDQLGAEPGTTLQELHRAILNQDSSLDIRPHQPAPQPSAIQMDFQPATPRMLPPDIPDFVGREKEVSIVLDVLTRDNGRGAPVVVITGPAGVGKTATSVRVAHELRPTYLDGQLYVNLHGFDAEHPVEPFEVLGRFLRALGVASMTIPSTLDERAELYRSLLVDRAILIILDNAANDSQVASLIPADDSCGVIINSRARIGTAFSSLTLGLTTLDPAGANAMLARIVGHERTESEPDAVRELIRLCDFLPLAVRVAAGRLATKPHWTIARLVHHLLDERRRLDRLSHGSLDVRASITLSYSSLSHASQTLLRRLGNLDLPEVTSWIAAALLNSSIAEAEDALEQLFDAQLVDVMGHDTATRVRYRLHDLVRLAAKERADLDEPPEQLVAARHRVFAALLTLIEAAHHGAFGGLAISNPLHRGSVGNGVIESVVVDPAAWCDEERQLIVGAARRAMDDGDALHSWGITCAAAMLFQLRGFHDDILALLSESRAHVIDAGDELGQAVVDFRTGAVCMDLQDYEQARHRLQEARDLFDRAGNDHGRALAESHLATVYRWQGELDAALQTYQRASSVLGGTTDLGARALVLRCIGQVYFDLGNLAEADAYYAAALTQARASGSQRSVAQVLFWRGMLRMKQSRYTSARSLFTRVRDVSRVVGDRYGEAQAIRGLGLCHQHEGQTTQALAELQEALRLVRQPRPTFIEAKIQKELDALSDRHGY